MTTAEATITDLDNTTQDSQEMELSVAKLTERREYRRHDMERQEIAVERWTGKKAANVNLGTIVDISAGGMRIRTTDCNVKVDQQIRVRIELPDYAGICPFVDTEKMQPKRDWVGWMAVNRIQKLKDGAIEVAGRLVDMDEIDRGMLGLYLSTQPLAA